VTGLDILNDPLAALLFKSLTSRSHGSLMYEQASGGTAVALARISKNVICHMDSKNEITPPQEGRISIRTPDQEVGLVHPRATERLETENQPSTKDLRVQMRWGTSNTHSIQRFGLS